MGNFEDRCGMDQRFIKTPRALDTATYRATERAHPHMIADYRRVEHSHMSFEADRKCNWFRDPISRARTLQKVIDSIRFGFTHPVAYLSLAQSVHDGYMRMRDELGWVSLSCDRASALNEES
jgi:hypothetical protein